MAPVFCVGYVPAVLEVALLLYMLSIYCPLSSLPVQMATVLESSTAILTVVLADPALSVRAQASWTFGNLVEGIVRNA